MKSIELYFYGPLKFDGNNNSLFNNELINKSGIYLWTIFCEDKYYIEYIGETGQSFYKRNKEHLIQVLGGNYRVLNLESLKYGKVEIFWNGMWRKGHRDKMNEFINSYLDFAPKLYDYITSINVFIAPLDCETHIRKRIEGAIAKNLKEQSYEINKFFPKDVKYLGKKRESKSDDVIKVNIYSSVAILGLPNIIYA